MTRPRSSFSPPVAIRRKLEAMLTAVDKRLRTYAETVRERLSQRYPLATMAADGTS